MCMYIRKSSNSKINLTPQERVDCITLLSHCRLKEYVTQCAYDDGVGSLLVAIDVLDDVSHYFSCLFIGTQTGSFIVGMIS